MTLQDKWVAVTRAAHQQRSFAEVLRARGAQAVALPTIEIAAVEGRLAEAAREAVLRAHQGGYAAVLFTSTNSVRFYGELAKTQSLEAPGLFRAARVFAIGEKTRGALQGLGIQDVVLAQSAVSEGLLATVKEALGVGLQDTRVLLPRALEGRDTVIRGLRDSGAQVDVVPLYETRPVPSETPLPSDPPLDWVTFTSPSSVLGFVRSYELPRGCSVACIGPVTETAAREAGLTVTVVAAEQSIEGLAQAMDSADI